MFSCQTSRGSMVLAVHLQPQPYGAAGREPTQFLQRPWDEHRAWMSIDMPNGRNRELSKQTARGTIYQVLLVCAFLLWGPNTLAVFFPGERVTIPNFGGLAACIQWARSAGPDMSFLN